VTRTIKVSLNCWCRQKRNELYIT